MHDPRAGLRGAARWLAGVALLLLAAGDLHAQTPAPADSSRPDTILVAVPDTVRTVRTAELESVRPVFPGATPFGSLLYMPRADDRGVITELDIAWSRYSTAFDVLEPWLHALPLSQGSAGLVRAFSVAGAAPRAVSWLSNGRPLEGPGGSGYDIELYPLEFVERVEILTGPRALLYGAGEALAAVNFVQPRFDVEASYARLWYTQDAGDFSGVDVMFARNVGRRTAVTVGVRRLATATDDNARFENQAISNWTTHAAFNWRPTRAWLVSLTDIYADATRGQNGGLTPESSFDPLNESVVQPFWSERSIQHELSLGAEWVDPRAWTDVVDSATGLASSDSAARAGGSIYYAVARRQIEAFDSVVTFEQGPAREDLDRLGVRGFVRIPVGALLLEVNALAELRERSTFRDALQDDGYRQAGVAATVPLGPAELVASARWSDGVEGQMLAAAAEGWLGRGAPLGVRAGLRVASTTCPCDIVDLGDTVTLDEQRTTALLEAAAWWRGGGRELDARGALRRSQSFSTSAGDQDVATVELRGSTPLWLFAIDARAITVLGVNDDRFAQWNLTADLYAPLRLFEGNLDLRVGTMLDVHSGLAGIDYDIPTGAFIAPFIARDPVDQTPEWSVYAHARFGTAYVRLAMRNLLDAERWTVYRYPERGRSFVLSVTWSFID